MSERKELGRIKSATFGRGGYQDAMIGFAVELGGEAWGVSDFVGTWEKRSERAHYSEAEWALQRLAALDRLQETLTAAKKDDVARLVGVPIEATFEGNTLKSWRVLTEVL